MIIEVAVQADIEKGLAEEVIPVEEIIAAVADNAITGVAPAADAITEQAVEVVITGMPATEILKKDIDYARQLICHLHIDQWVLN